MAPPFANKYIHRKVAETAAKPCDVCYRPSTSVLITEDNKDFFYVCPVHLTDRNFCSPIHDPNAAKLKREQQLAAEKAKLLKEFEEKQKKKKEKDDKAKAKAKGADKDKDKASDKDKDDDDGKKEEKSAEKTPEESGAGVGSEDSESTTEERYIIGYSLKITFFEQRVKRRRQAEAAKRDRERASQPGYFPDAPTHAPGE